MIGVLLTLWRLIMGKKSNRPNIFTQAFQSVLPGVEDLVRTGVEGAVPIDDILDGLVDAADAKIDQLAEGLPLFWRVIVRAGDRPALKLIVDLAVRPLIDRALGALAAA